MAEVSERYGRIAADLDRRIRGCAADGWGAASPCEGWSAKDVVVHVVDTHRRVLAMLDGGEARPVELDDEVIDGWDSATGDVAAALADDSRASTVVTGMMGEQPWEQVVGRLLCADTLAHTWDFATATGQDDRLDPAAVAAATEFLTPMDEAIRRPGGFGPKLEPAAGADDQTRLLAFLGRRREAKT